MSVFVGSSGSFFLLMAAARKFRVGKMAEKSQPSENKEG
jgi:hypothetical protein